MVGYVTEDGTPVNNEISTGASALFPIGAQLLRHPSLSPTIPILKVLPIRPPEKILSADLHYEKLCLALPNMDWGFVRTLP